MAPSVKVAEPSVAENDHAASSDNDEGEPTSIAEIVYSNFDSYQNDNGSSSTTTATRAAASIRNDLRSASMDVDAEDTSQEAADAVVRCLDSAMATIATNKKGWNESVSSVLELAAAFACHGTNKNDGAAIVAQTVINRVVEYSTVDKDAIRVEACNLLGLCVRYLMESSKPATSILKKKGGMKKKSVKVGMSATDVASSSDNKDASSSSDVSGWKAECILQASKALLPRITDKIAKVRNAAISACSSLYGDEVAFAKLVRGSDDFFDINDSIQAALLWIMVNDTSAGNRALVAKVLPTSPALNPDEEEEVNANIQCIIERIKDVDGKVREAALDSLRENVNFVEQLTEDQRVEILRNGFTKRCQTTYAKTVELICTNWLKSTKFDPIALLDHLNPVLNDTICEQVSQVLLRVASTIDCESTSEKGVALVQKHFGGPEIRELQQMVLKKRDIIPPAVQDEEDDGNNENGEDEAEETDENKTTSPALSPSLALFLRVKCDVSTNKSDTISDIIGDIPTLCNLLNSHIDKLIQFNNDADYDEIDEDAMDEAAAFEDDQNFICLQLIHMAKSSELEEGSRRHFISIMRRILARLATPDDLVEACVKAMAAAHDKESHFALTISEILVDVEDDDTFHSAEHDEKAIIIVRQMRIIAILSIVLESISGQMVDHPILDGFFEHLSPAITSKNAIVREHGVICLSKFCLLSSEEKVMDEFKPLLMTIAGSAEERVEVRAQATLALCDLALIHERMLLGPSNGEDVNDDDESSGPSMPFKDMLLEMMGHTKPGIVIIAAEITAKLLLAGRLRDPKLIAWLLVIYFDTSLTTDLESEDNMDVADVAKQVGSPIRLQQLLSIFFPTYSMSSLDANDDMMASVAPLMSIVNEKLSGMRKEHVKESLAQRWPIAKMVEYACHNVDLADKKKNDETKADAANVAKTDGEQEGENSDENDGDVGSKEALHEDTNGNEVPVDEVGDVIVEASSTLLASINVAEFLSEEGADSAPTFYARVLAKILGNACIDVDAEDRSLLCRLKLCVGEAEYANDDGPTVKSIKKLADLLVDVEEEEDESVVSEENSVKSNLEDDIYGEKEEDGAKEDALSEEMNKSMEKENPRQSIGSVKSTTSKLVSVEGGDKRLSSHRTSLGDVNCN